MKPGGSGARDQIQNMEKRLSLGEEGTLFL